MELTPRGADFIKKHEGFVKRAYRDPVGVWTIGTGFTNMCAAAVRVLGKIGPGKTITAAQNQSILIAAVREQYGPPVERALPGCKQQEYDAGASACFNAGPAIMRDTWARLWRGGQKAAAWQRLRKTRVTAKGRRLRGLVRRRLAESKLGQFGDYGDGKGNDGVVIGDGEPRQETSKPRTPDPVVRDAQKDLIALGHKIKADGWMGPKTKAAILTFQKRHPNLTNDGILGPATIAQLERATREKGDRKGGGALGILGAISAVATWFWESGLLPAVLIGLGVLALVLIAVHCWTYREEIASMFNRLLRREVA